MSLLRYALICILLVWSSFAMATSSFEKALSTMTDSELRYHRDSLSARLAYLQDPAAAQNSYVIGIMPSTDVLVVKNGIERARALHTQYSQAIREALRSPNESCQQFFDMDQRVFSKIMENASLIAQNPVLGSQSPVGYFWNENKQHKPSPPSYEIQRATVQFELLLQASSFLNTYMMNDMEDAVGLLQVDKRPCFCQNRARIKGLNAQRMAALEELRLALLGKRGIWDVLPLTNGMSAFAQEELNTTERQIWMGLGIGAATTVAWYYTAPTIYSSIAAYSANGALWLSRTGQLLQVGTLAYLGYSSYPQFAEILSSNKETVNILNSTAQNSVIPFAESLLTLPSSKYALALMVNEYEMSIHKFMVRQGPGKLAQTWLPNELKRAGSMDTLMMDYTKKLDVIYKQIELRQAQSCQ